MVFQFWPPRVLLLLWKCFLLRLIGSYISLWSIYQQTSFRDLFVTVKFTFSKLLFHHLIRRFVWHKGFSTNTYIGLVWYNTFYYVNNSWKLHRWSLSSKNLTWDLPGQGHIRIIPATNHSLSTVQIESSWPGNDWRLPPLHPPRTGIDIPHLWIVPTKICFQNGQLLIACLSPTQDHQIKNTNARPMHLVTAWVRVE